MNRRIVDTKKIKMDFRFGIILYAVMLILGQQEELVLLTIFCIFVHETGHIVAIIICRGRIEEIKADIFGAEISLSPYPKMSYGREIAISLAGPMSSALCAYIFSSCERVFLSQARFEIAGICMLLAVINLAPVRVMDGGRALHAILCIFLSPYTADMISKSAGAAFSLLITAAGIAVMAIGPGHNFSLFVLGIYLLYKTFAGTESCFKKTCKRRLKPL